MGIECKNVDSISTKCACLDCTLGLEGAVGKKVCFLPLKQEVIGKKDVNELAAQSGRPVWRCFAFLM